VRNLSAGITTLERLSRDHLAELHDQRGPATHTLRARSTDLLLFLVRARERGITRPVEVSRTIALWSRVGAMSTIAATLARDVHYKRDHASCVRARRADNETDP
jgi:hypothetical protein